MEEPVSPTHPPRSILTGDTPIYERLIKLEAISHPQSLINHFLWKQGDAVL